MLAALGATALLLVFSLHGVYANTSTQLTTTGAVLNLGVQTYSVSGGTVVYASVDGHTLDPGATLEFTVSAQVVGLSTSGTASIVLKGTSGKGAHSVAVDSTIAIDTSAGDSGIPYGCTTACNSMLPMFFVGAAATAVTIDGSPGATPSPPTFELESPYFNPWGAPIVLASQDSSVVIVTTYTAGTITWQGTQSGGSVGGTLGGSAVTGNLLMVSNETENLVTGIATDTGTMALSGMSAAPLDVQGSYSGTSTIPTNGTSDCSSVTTGIPGTCTETGFQSKGSASLASSQVTLTGNYYTGWSVPALGFTSTFTASLQYLQDLPPCTPTALQAGPARVPTVGLDSPPIVQTPNATNTLAFYVTMPDPGWCVGQNAASLGNLSVSRVAYSIDGGPLQNATYAFQGGEFECSTASSTSLISDWQACSGSMSSVEVWNGSLVYTVMPTGLHTLTVEAWGQGGTGPFVTSLLVNHSLYSYAGQSFEIGAQGMPGTPVVVKLTGVEPMVTSEGIVMLNVTQTFHTIVPQSGVIYGSFLPHGQVSVTAQNSTVWKFDLGASMQTQQLTLSG